MLESIILITAIIIAIIIGFSKPKEDYHSNWNQLLAGFKFSTNDFYKLLRDEMNSHDIDGLDFRIVNLNTGSAFSSQRKYMRVKWKDYYYDLCFAPFGDGCFVSWWLIFTTSPAEELLTKIPFIGNWIKRTFFPITYYKVDTASMFMSYAQHSVLAVIDEITKETGIRLSEDQRKPNINDFFKRK